MRHCRAAGGDAEYKYFNPVMRSWCFFWLAPALWIPGDSDSQLKFFVISCSEALKRKRKIGNSSPNKKVCFWGAGDYNQHSISIYVLFRTISWLQLFNINNSTYYRYVYNFQKNSTVQTVLNIETFHHALTFCSDQKLICQIRPKLRSWSRSRSRNYLFDKYVLQSVWRMLG